MTSSYAHATGAGRDRSGAPRDPIIRALWARRIERRLTLKEVSLLSGVSLGSIRTAELGIHNPRLDRLCAWAGALGITISALDTDDHERLDGRE